MHRGKGAGGKPPKGPSRPSSAAPSEADGGHEGIVKDMQGGQSNMLVAVRLRPMWQKEKDKGIKHIVRIPDQHLVMLLDPNADDKADVLRVNRTKEKRFAFDYAFDEHTDQRTVYEKTTRFLVDGVLKGFNATVFAYGATGSGKTHTMIGPKEDPGVMFQTLQELFQGVVASREDSSDFDIKASFLEIYNENIRDLLRPSAEVLDLREDPIKGVCVAGISEFSTTSADEVMDLLQEGNRHRTQEPTDANQTSSRSHAVLQVTIQEKERGQGAKASFKVGKLSMIDLAGSERAKQTNNRGVRMLEGANINRSLLALGNVINALAEKAKNGGRPFVPYRDSKLTRLLKDSLGGNCRTVMIAAISPSSVQFEDTHNTLKYANRAKNIKTNVSRNVLNVDYHVDRYNQIIEELRSEIANLKEKLEQAKVAKTQRALTGVPPKGPSSEEVEAGEDWREEIAENFEERLQLKREVLDLDSRMSVCEKEMKKLKLGGHGGLRARGVSDVSEWGAESDAGVSAFSPGDSEEILEKERKLQREVKSLESRKTEAEGRLAKNVEEGKRLQAELPERVENADMRSFLLLLFKSQLLEVENMELSELNKAAVEALEARDLEIQHLRQQVRLRDRMLEEREARMSADQLSDMKAAVPHEFVPCDTVVDWGSALIRRLRKETGDEDEDPPAGVNLDDLEIPHPARIAGVGGKISPSPPPSDGASGGRGRGRGGRGDRGGESEASLQGYDEGPNPLMKGGRQKGGKRPPSAGDGAAGELPPVVGLPAAVPGGRGGAKPPAGPGQIPPQAPARGRGDFRNKRQPASRPRSLPPLPGRTGSMEDGEEHILISALHGRRLSVQPQGAEAPQGGNGGKGGQNGQAAAVRRPPGVGGYKFN